MAKLWVLFGVMLALRAEFASGKTCKKNQVVKNTEYYTYSVSCGWWNWGSCTRRGTRTKYSTKITESCCAGSYGSVEDGCPGVCSYNNPQRSSACPGSGICRHYQCDNSGVNATSLPVRTDLTFSENNDKERLLWKVDADCFVQYSCTCGGSPCQCSKTVPCTQCTVQSTNGVAEVRNGIEIYRKKCSNSTCRDCGKYPGCLDHKVSYSVNVECGASGYTDNDKVRQTLILVVEQASTAVIELPPVAADPLKLNTKANINDVVLTIPSITIPSSEKGYTYNLTGPVSKSTGNSLFNYDDKTRQIKVNSDLSQEPGGVYTLTLCIVLRRADKCVDLVVEIERITTTSTTTTTTTTRTTIPEPEEEYICSAIGIWKTIRGFDFWCNLVCGSKSAECPYKDHCRCTGVSKERLGCKAGGIFESNPAMDAWCDLSCNYGEYSHCPTNSSVAGYCVCDPPSK